MHLPVIVVTEAAAALPYMKPSSATRGKKLTQQNTWKVQEAGWEGCTGRTLVGPGCPKDFTVGCRDSSALPPPLHITATSITPHQDLLPPGSHISAPGWKTLYYCL